MEPVRSTCGCSQEYADFWAADPPVHRSPRALVRAWRDGAAPRRAWRRLAVVATAAAVAVVPTPHELTTPDVADPSQDLDSLVAKADELSDEYNGELRDMDKVIEEAKQAADRAEATQKQVEKAREQVQDLAVASYQKGGLEPALTLFVEESPQDIIDRAVLVEHLSTSNHDRIERLRQAIERDRKAQENAESRVQEAEEDLQELQDRREEVQALIADYPVQQMGPPDNLTPRTRQMRDIFIEEFGEGPGVGCYRPNGGYVNGEHPKGRACDFMMTNDGVMPPQHQIDRGWEIAEYAQENAERLGIMYIIYRQQIWDIRRSDEGWRDMPDRGSITQNHYDHVHISMF